jgi:predicted metalloendopeptidase
MKLNVTPEDFDSKISMLIEDGWNVESIKKVEYFIVKATKKSGDFKPEKINTKIGYLSILDKKTVYDIAKALGIKTTNLEKFEVLHELRKFKRPVVEIAWESVLEQRNGKVKEPEYV